MDGIVFEKLMFLKSVNKLFLVIQTFFGQKNKKVGKFSFLNTSSDRKKLVQNKKLYLQPLKSGKWHVPNDNFVYFEVY